MKEMEEKQEAPKRQIYTIDDTEYYFDSFSQEAKDLINSLGIIDNEIEHNKIQNDIFIVSRAVYSDKLKNLLDTFEKVPSQEENTQGSTDE